MRYAFYDSTLPRPTQVSGWYDTELITYTDMPAEENLRALSDEEWTAHFAQPTHWAIDDVGALVQRDPPIPDLTPQQASSIELATRLGQGISFTSSDLALDGRRFALDDLTLNQIGSVARDFAAGLGLPGDAEAFIYPDIDGAPYSFTGPEVVKIYRAMRNLVAALTGQAAIMGQGGPPDWPDQTIAV